MIFVSYESHLNPACCSYTFFNVPWIFHQFIPMDSTAYQHLTWTWLGRDCRFAASPGGAKPIDPGKFRDLARELNVGPHDGRAVRGLAGSIDQGVDSSYWV